MTAKKNHLPFYIKAGIVLALIVNSTFSNAQLKSTNSISLKGEDFQIEKNIPLFCDTITNCWTIHEGLKRTVFIQLIGMVDNRKVVLQIETPAKPGAHKIKLDADGDQKIGEKFYLEISGHNPPVDNLIYTPEDELDDAVLHIDALDEESGHLSGTFSAKFFNSITAVKRVIVSGTFSLDRN